MKQLYEKVLLPLWIHGHGTVKEFAEYIREDLDSMRTLFNECAEEG